MADNFGPVYEVTHTLERSIVADFDAWLDQHVAEMLLIQGICRATTYVADDTVDGHPVRVSHYYFESDHDLEDYLTGPAATMRQSATSKFSNQFIVNRRVLRESDVIAGQRVSAKACLNCDATLTGQYCGNCGQRASSRLISLWELVRDSFGDLLEMDSRVWRTMIPLMVKPGALTRNYLQGRRARFMPPFRTYLVLSICFFLVAFFDPREEFGLLFDSQQEAELAPDEIDQNTQDIRDEIIQDLVDEGVLATDEDAPVADDFCHRLEAGGWAARGPSWLTAERLGIACERVAADNGKALTGKILNNVPAALIALLPLMALILKALYPLSKGYYVEHVLFVIHFHAFIFLILSLQILFSRLISIAGLPDTVSSTTLVAVTFYIPVYFFKALRRVYGQGWVITLLKYLMLLLAYLGGLIGILLTTAVFAAFSI